MSAEDLQNFQNKTIATNEYNKFGVWPGMIGKFWAFIVKIKKMGKNEFIEIDYKKGNKMVRGKFEKIDESLVFEIINLKEFYTFLRLLRSSPKTLHCELETMSSFYHKILKRITYDNGFLIPLEFNNCAQN